MASATAMSKSGTNQLNQLFFLFCVCFFLIDAGACSDPILISVLISVSSTVSELMGNT
jgi:hypothetical protein